MSTRTAGIPTGGWLVHTAPRASTLLYALAAARPAVGPWLVPANVCPVVPLALSAAGVAVEFLDIDPATLGMDLHLLSSRLRNGTTPAGVVDVRTYGADAEADQRRRVIRASVGSTTCIVDDRCAGVPLTNPDALGDARDVDVVLFSTGYGKYLDLGGAGHAFLRPGVDLASVPEPTVPFRAIETWYKRAIAERVPLAQVSEPLRPASLQWVPHGPGPEWSDHRRAIEAALPTTRQHKSVLNEIYYDYLGDADVLSEDHQRWRFSLRVAARDTALQAITAAGGFASAHYYPATALYGNQPAPVAHTVHSTILNLFNDAHYSPAMARRTAQVVRRHVEVHHA